MSQSATDPEMKRRFDAAEKTWVGETELAQAPLRPTAESLRAHFASPVGRAETPLENPHVEPRVTAKQRAEAIPASVLLAIVQHEDEPTVLITKRNPDISHPGHWVFPGGRADVSDSGPIDTALREAHEEIGLDRSRVDLLGRLGDYVSHSGFRIAPTVALLEPPLDLKPNPAEVEEIAEIPLSRLVDSSSYFLFRLPGRPGRAHFAMSTVPNRINPDDTILLTV